MDKWLHGNYNTLKKAAMKSTITILGILYCSVLFGQRTEQVPGEEPAEARDVQISGKVSEAVAIINAVRSGVNTATKETSKRTFTEADYQKLATKADEFMLDRKYTDAILLYKEILKEREDQSARDRILEAEALRAKQVREEEQIKKDAALRAKAEFESSSFNEMRVVHLTGALISDMSSASRWTSKALDMKDPHSSFLKLGKYNGLAEVLRTAINFTLDGIAIPANTRLIVYKEKNCSGEILLDVTGPAIINNYIYSENERYNFVNTKEFIPELQPYFPQAVRSWSTTNMRDWVKGSMEVTVP